MDKKKKKHLEAKGWKVGDAAEFLGLSAGEKALVAERLRKDEGLKAEGLKAEKKDSSALGLKKRG